MANEILRDFLVAVGWKVDGASASQAEAAARRVEKTFTEADTRTTKTVTANAMNRAKAALDEAGVRNATVDQIRRKAVEMIAADDAATKATAQNAAVRSANRLKEVRSHEDGAKRQKSTYADLATAANLWARAFVEAAQLATTATRQFIGGFDQFAFISQRTGASANTIKGLGYAFSQVGSSADSAMQAVESFAKARRTNPGVDAMLRNYGVNTTGDSVDVLGSAVDAIQARHPYFAGSQVANILGLSEEQYGTFVKHREAIKAYRKEYGETQRALGVNSDDTARASATVARAVTSLTATLGVLAEKLYMALAPMLERIAKGFRDWLAANPGKVEGIMRGIASATEAVGKALLGVGDWLSKNDNQKKLEEFWNGFTNLIKTTAEELRKLFDILRQIGKVLGLGEGGDPVGRGVTKFLDLFRSGGGTGAGGAGLGIGAIGGASLLDGGVPAEVGSAPGTGERSKSGIVRRGWEAAKRAVGLGPKEDKTSYNFTGANADVLRQAAKELGTSPEDLATVISYETRGTFSPSIWGGKGGNYMGLIQFGASERKQFGANDKQTFAEQMPAVVRYLKTRGFKPGMGLLDLYSTINAGRPGRYSASDGNGTVRSHVDTMRRTHGGRVARFLASGNPPVATTQAPPQPSNENGPPAVTTRRKAAAGAPVNMTPGGFNVDDYLRSQPMGASTANTDNSRSTKIDAPVNISVQGAGDPQATGQAVGRAMEGANGLLMRNVASAVR